jgi:hypothetical protein
MNWLETILQDTEEAEAPRSFFFWSALAAISAVVKNKVYLDRYFYKLYPNVYIFLVAKSGLRKGIPIAMAKALVKEVDNTRVISGRNSIQGIIKDLSITVTTPGKPPLRDACGFIVSGEFSTVLIRDPEALTILTDLHDGHYNPEWKNTLKGTGVEELKGVNITVLGAVNQTHFKDMISQKTGGFIARTMIVEEVKRATKNPLLDKPEHVLDIKKLAEHLKKLALLEGEFKWDDEAKETYRKWYMAWNPEDREDNDLTIRPEDLSLATKACSRFERTARTVTSGHGGQSEFGPKIKLLIDELIVAPQSSIKRSTFLSKHYGDIDAYDLDRVVATLAQAGALNERKIKNDIVYEASKKLIDEYKKKETV